MLHILHILYISIFDMLIDGRAAFGDSEDDKQSYPESQALQSPADSPPQSLQQPPAVPSHADLDKRKVMLAAGGPNYETCCAIQISILGQIQRTSQASDVEEKPCEPI